MENGKIVQQSSLASELERLDSLSPEQVQAAVDACHPCAIETEESYTADFIAMKFIHGRHEKREIVNMMRWLIMGCPPPPEA